jgi:hypothetical protein
LRVAFMFDDMNASQRVKKEEEEENSPEGA